MKPLVIYHANCADGFGAAFAAWLKLGDEALYVPFKYGEETVPDSKGRDVYILDFSFPRDVMDLIFEDAKRVVWLDHHKTAFEMWCGAIPPKGSYVYMDENDQTKHINLDNDKSGAMLAWKYFHPDTEVPMLVKHIDDYDRWQFKIDGTKEFNKALWSYAPWTFAQWKAILALTNHQYAQDEFNLGIGFNKEGAAILRAHDQNVQSVVKGAARKCRISFPVQLNPGITGDGLADAEWFDIGLAANCPPHLTSDVGHELATQSGTFGLCWTLNQTKLAANCSLRSNGDYDVSAIAKAFGGGGHKNAAGFEVPIGTLLGWLK